MKYHVFKLVIFILLAAILNIAVAWGCATWSVGGELYNIYFDSAQPASLDLKNQRWLHARGWKNSPGDILTFGDLRAFGFYQIEYFSFRPQIDDLDLNSHWPFATRTRAGWPWLCFHAEEWIDLAEYEKRNSGEYYYPMELYDCVGGVNIFVTVVESLSGVRVKAARILPLRPLLIGFAMNTIFYAGILWFLWSSPFAARRMIRRKRGLCIKCGYDLRGTSGSGCSECGWKRDEVKA